MSKSEQRIITALAALGGEATSNAIWQKMVEQSRWGDTKLGHFLVRAPHFDLINLERRGVLTSYWGIATAKRGWLRPRIYKIVE